MGRWPAEERGGSAATATGNRLQLASPGSSLEQASRPSARGPGVQGPMLQEEMGGGGGIMPRHPGGGGNLRRAVPGPPRSYIRGPAVGPPPSPSSQPLQPASPRTPPPAEAAAPGLRTPGWRGRVGLACDTGGVEGLGGVEVVVFGGVVFIFFF